MFYVIHPEWWIILNRFGNIQVVGKIWRLEGYPLYLRWLGENYTMAEQTKWQRLCRHRLHKIIYHILFFQTEFRLSWAHDVHQNDQLCHYQVQQKSEPRGLLQAPHVPKLADPHNTKIGHIADVESFLEYMYFTLDLNKHLNSRSNEINVNFWSQLE